MALAVVLDIVVFMSVVVWAATGRANTASNAAVDMNLFIGVVTR